MIPDRELHDSFEAQGGSWLAPPLEIVSCEVVARVEAQCLSRELVADPHERFPGA